MAVKCWIVGRLIYLDARSNKVTNSLSLSMLMRDIPCQFWHSPFVCYSEKNGCWKRTPHAIVLRVTSADRHRRDTGHRVDIGRNHHQSALVIQEIVFWYKLQRHLWRSHLRKIGDHLPRLLQSLPRTWATIALHVIITFSIIYLILTT